MSQIILIRLTPSSSSISENECFISTKLNISQTILIPINDSYVVDAPIQNKLCPYFQWRSFSVIYAVLHLVLPMLEIKRCSKTTLTGFYPFLTTCLHLVAYEICLLLQGKINSMLTKLLPPITLQMFEANYRRNADKICDF